MNVFYVILLLLLVVIVVTPLRRVLLTRFLLEVMRKKMPAISATEQDAIDAGTIWWEKTLMRGAPDWQALSEVAPATLSREEQQFLDHQVEELCARVNDWETHQSGDLAADVWDYLKSERFFAMGIPKAYGGLEFSATAHSEVIQKISTRSVTAAVTAMVPNSLGPAELLLHYGTSEQKEHYLPRLATGEEVPCFALTAPDAGSDAGAIPDTGVVEKGEYQGEEVLGIRLNWSKRYITLAPVATLIGMAFHLYDPDKLLGDEEDIGITVALIPADTQGVSIGHRHNPLYIPFQNGPIHGKDVFIPLSFVIGGEEYVGKGWRMLMESLAAGRSISLPSLSCGTGKLASRVTTAYALVRDQFGLSIGRFEGVSERVANIAVATYTVNAVRSLSARAVDLGERPAVLSAIAKYNTTESMRRVINDAMDVVGGKGICAGPQNLLAHAYMAVPIGITVEGANILTRSMIVFGQGAIRSNPNVLAEIEAIANPDHKQAVIDFDKALVSHVLSITRELVRAVKFGFAGAFISSPAPANTEIAASYHKVNRLSAAFAIIAELSMVILGGKLKVKESISGRLADGISALYQASAVLKQHSDRGEPQEERPLVKAALAHELFRVEQALDGVLRNFPYPWISWPLRWITFPFGMHAQLPGDDELHAITRSLMQQNELREQLTAGIYLPKAEGDALQLLESAMQATLEVAEPRARLKQKFGSGGLKPAAIAQTIGLARDEGVISDEEMSKLNRWLDLRAKVIAVDDFAAEVLS